MQSTATITKKEKRKHSKHNFFMTIQWQMSAHSIFEKNKWQEHEQAKSSIIHIIRAQQSVAYLDSKKMFE